MKGCRINRDVHPGTRVGPAWYGRQDMVGPVGGGLGVPGAVSSAPTLLRMYPRFSSKRVGTHIPRLEDRNIVVGNFQFHLGDAQTVATQYQPDWKLFTGVSIFCQGAARHDIYASMRDDGAATSTRALVFQLRTPPQLINNHLLPSRRQQHANNVPLDETVEMVLFFQRRHCNFVDGAAGQGGELRFTKAALAAEGGPDNWGFGVPIMCPVEQLEGIRDDAGAVIQVGGVNVSAGLLDPLGPRSAIQSALAGTYDFATVDAGFVENNDSFARGTKPLFHRAHAAGLFHHQIRIRPWVKLQKQVTTNLDAVPSIDPSTGLVVYPETAQYYVYPNNNAVPQADVTNVHQTQVSTVEYVLSSDARVESAQQPAGSTQYNALADATKVVQWNEYISEISTKWFKRQAQTTTILATGVATTLFFMWTDANQPLHADVNDNLQTQVSVTAYYDLDVSHVSWLVRSNQCTDEGYLVEGVLYCQRCTDRSEGC